MKEFEETPITWRTRNLLLDPIIQQIEVMVSKLNCCDALNKGIKAEVTAKKNKNLSYYSKLNFQRN